MDKITDEILDRTKNEIQRAFESMGDAYQHSELGILEEVNRLQGIADSAKESKMSEFEGIILEGMYGSKIEDLREKALSDLRGAFLLIIYGLIERILYKVATKIDRKQLSVPTIVSERLLPFEEIKGVKANRAVIYLKYVSRLDVPLFFEREFILISELRDAFAHHAGVIEKKKKERLVNLKVEFNKEYFDRITDFTIVRFDEESFVIRPGSTFVFEVI